MAAFQRLVNEAMIDGELVTATEAAFAPDFNGARRLFRDHAPDCRTYPSPAKGPASEPLTTETAWIGNPDAARVMAIISGVHGAEGYAGSAIQIDLLRHRKRLALADDEAILLIHALNPYGFAWDRRVTEEGSDLNRNFIDFTQGLPDNPGYDAIARHLVPGALDPATIAAAEEAIAAYRRQHGEHAFQVARKSGQYRHPTGMFYGGTGPANARHTLERIMAEELLAARAFVTVIDVHTGLGPYGYGEAQSEHPGDSRSHALVRAMFGEAVTSVDLGTSFSVPVRGTAQEAWERLRGDGSYAYLCLEFGTYDQEMSRRAYRQDHWLHAHGDPASTDGLRIREEMRRFFAPPEAAWREMVIARGRQIIRQGLIGGRLLA